MPTKDIIIANPEACAVIVMVVQSYDIFHQCKVVKKVPTYPDNNSPHTTITVEGREKDLFAIEAMARLSNLSLGWKSPGFNVPQPMLVNGHRIDILQREYEPLKFTNDIMLDGKVHSPAVGDDLLHDVLGKTVLYARMTDMNGNLMKV